MEQQELVNIIKKYGFLVLYILCYFPILCIRYFEAFDLLEIYTSLERVIPVFYSNGHIFLLWFLISCILIIVLAPKLNKVFGKRVARKVFLWIVVLTCTLPITKVARIIYMKQNLELYNEAVAYVLREENGKQQQWVAIPEEYDSTTFGSGSLGDPDYVYLMRDESTIKILFSRGGLAGDKGYQYVITLPDAKYPYKKSWKLFHLNFESDNGGVWDWAFYYWEDLPYHDDRNWK